MGDSSKDKIYAIFRELPEFKTFKQTVLELIGSNEPKFFKMNFVSRENRLIPLVVISVRCHDGDREFAFQHVPPSSFFDPDAFKKVFASVFGVVKAGKKKPIVPTFNVSLEKALEHASTKLREEIERSTEYREMSNKVNILFNGSKETEWFKAEHAKFAELHMIEKIKKCLHEFRNIDESTVRKAIDEFFIESVVLD